MPCTRPHQTFEQLRLAPPGAARGGCLWFTTRWRSAAGLAGARAAALPRPERTAPTGLRRRGAERVARRRRGRLRVAPRGALRREAAARAAARQCDLLCRFTRGQSYGKWRTLSPGGFYRRTSNIAFRCHRSRDSQRQRACHLCQDQRPRSIRRQRANHRRIQGCRQGARHAAGRSGRGTRRRARAAPLSYARALSMAQSAGSADFAWSEANSVRRPRSIIKRSYSSKRV